MSKNTKTVKQPLSDKAKMSIWISIICVVAVIVLVVTLILVDFQKAINPDDETSGSTGSSSLTIKNGDFLYAESTDTSYPYSAQDWTKYTYKEPTSSTSHNFAEIESSEKVVMGIVNTNESVWDEVSTDLVASGLGNITNPGIYSEDAIDQAAVEEDEIDIANVYIIAAKQATTASIMSQSFSISSMTSAKITVWLNTQQLEGKATVMLQNSAGTALEKSASGVQYWYAYDFDITKTVTTENNGWEKHEFYVFNRSSSTKTVKCNVGLGSVYSGETAEGVLFVDSIEYETVTANEYRLHYADTDHHSYVIPSTEADNATTTVLAWNEANKLLEGGVDGYLAEEASKVNGETYSPFIASQDTFDIYKTNESLTLTKNIDNANDNYPDYVHFYFWVRIVEGSQNKLASVIDIIAKDVTTADGKELTSKKEIVAVEDITEDNNCGWAQYHVYVKPDQDAKTASVSLTIKWSDTGLDHDGIMYVSSPIYEVITDKQYNSASSSGTSIKADMSRSGSSLGVSNGSFYDVNDANKTQPSNWTPVYAGSNAIYKDGKEDEAFATGLNKTNVAYGTSGVATGADKATYDDAYGSYLVVDNALATSHGYLSDSISLSANSIYRLSVIAKGNPYIYVINNSLERENAVIAKFEAPATNNVEIDNLLCQFTDDNWVRYYFIIETGDEALTLNVALFNGKLDGTTATGKVLYDQVALEKIGSYTVGEDAENEDATLYAVTYTSANNGYADLFETYFENVDGLTTEVTNVEFTQSNVQTVRVTAEEWTEMRTIPEEEEEDEEEDDTTTDTETDIDVGLLLSVISSISLVAALGVVVVIKIFRKKRA